MSGPIHTGTTRRRGLQYLFYDKRHEMLADAAWWNPELTQQQEFDVVDTADFHEIEGEGSRPSKQVFQTMVTAGLITINESKRLSKGDHI